MTKEAFFALNGPVLLDGATGSNLMKCGLPRGGCTEAWVLEHPQVTSIVIGASSTAQLDDNLGTLRLLKS